MGLGVPSVNIAFIEQSITAIQRGERGIIAMILTDAGMDDKSSFTVFDVSDIPEGLSEANKQQLKFALMGYQTAPRKIIGYCMKTSAGYTDALKWAATQKFNYLVATTAETDEKTQDIVSWIKSQRTNNHMTYKAVLSNTAADCEAIVNLTSGATMGDTAYTAEQLCSRVAGIICGTPLTMSCTYAPLTEMSDCDRLTETELSAAVDRGELKFMWDGEKVKLCRGVNSFVTTADGKGESYQKIKIMDAMDMIADDIRLTAQDSYIGKYANSYDNKCLLVTAINGYFNTLISDKVLGSGSCKINVEAQRNFFVSQGGKLVIDGETVNVEDCSDDDIKRGNTKSKVFLRADISILDAIEDIELPIYIG